MKEAFELGCDWKRPVECGLPEEVGLDEGAESLVEGLAKESGTEELGELQPQGLLARTLGYQREKEPEQALTSEKSL